MNIRKMTVLAALCVATALPSWAGTGKSISINFAGPRDSTANPGDSSFSAVGGSALFGALPVAGDNWNNFQTYSSTYGSGVASASSIKLNDGTVAAGVSASWNASCTYSVSASSTTDNIIQPKITQNTDHRKAHAIHERIEIKEEPSRESRENIAKRNLSTLASLLADYYNIDQEVATEILKKIEGWEDRLAECSTAGNPTKLTEINDDLRNFLLENGETLNTLIKEAREGMGEKY